MGHIAAIIPARGNSKGIPRKNLIDFCGKPLIAWSIIQARESRSVEGVFVSTDSPEIAGVARAFGAQVIMRPDELATDESPSEAALLHAMGEIEKSRALDAVVFLQATSPVRENADIDGAIFKFEQDGADSLFSAALLEDFCAWEEREGALRSLTYDYRNRGRRQNRRPYYLENGSIYVFKPEVLKNSSNRLGGRISAFTMPLWKSFEIDSLSDVALCEHYMRRLAGRKTEQIKMSEIGLVVYDFDGVFTDNRVILREDGTESVTVSRADGLAVEMLREREIPQVILTKERNRVVDARAAKLKIPVMSGVDDKKRELLSLLANKNIRPENTVYIGNDLNDIEAMGAVGWPVCPSDACDEVRRMARIVLSAAGGSGVVREFLNHIKDNGIKNREGGNAI